MGAVLVPALLWLGIAMTASGSDKKIAVYYLSPTVLTRTVMSPERLKVKEFRVHGETALATAATLLSLARSGERRGTDRPTKYDFRLCLSSKPEEVCFNAEGTVVLIQGKTFSLTSADQQMVLDVYSRLDGFSTKPR